MVVSVIDFIYKSLNWRSNVNEFPWKLTELKTLLCMEGLTL